MPRFVSYHDFYTRGPYASYTIQHGRLGGADGRLLHIAQPSGDFPDPAIPEFFVYVALRGASELAFDWGCGRWCGAWHEGDISIAPPGVSTRIHVSDPHAFVALALPAPFVRVTMRELADDGFSDFGVLYTRTFRDQMIDRLMRELWSHADQGWRHSQLAADNLILSIMAALASKPARQTEARHALDDRRLGRVIAFVEEHLAANPTLSELASACALSPVHFARQFRRRMGLSPHQYVLDRRVARARALLAATGYPITDIAYETGFSNQSHMTAVFAARAVPPPARFRRARRQEN
ncbi:AraC family transcriptional regulator [Bradyrhizobium sp.]|uniref:AraC family transcriptional regulator n=1 Tax=Bradyrhizobium sp. TaxID=376 RepID=UPI0025C5085B|nr:AraC family transcriptional regulator [Bradyrhizobium sp.]